jgi:hypothetical protein
VEERCGGEMWRRDAEEGKRISIGKRKRKRKRKMTNDIVFQENRNE